ncbi:MAG: hypothetical protein HUU20_09050 [Pirellulales bacterium]|nr:hypothetical protein [Pirellulales bacterium]
MFRAGAATSNITPLLGTVISGGFQNHAATKVHDELHVRCLALDDGTTQIVFAVVDSCVIDRGVFDAAKKLAHAATGLPVENMLMSATHTHSGGAMTDVHQSKADPVYREFAIRRIADGVRLAVGNLAPARIAFGCGQVPQHVFNRRWYLKPGVPMPDPFGSQDRVKMNPGSGMSPAGTLPFTMDQLDRPAGPTDAQAWFITVRSPDGRPVALLANYSLHYVGGMGAGEISADYFGAFADRIEQLLGADRQGPPLVGILSNGASGDINNIDYRLPRAIKPPYEQIALVAEDVAQEVLRIEKTLNYHNWLPLGVAQKDVMLGIRKPGSREEVEKARAIMKGSKDYPRMVTVEEKYARETVVLSEYPPRVSAPLQVFKIGDLRVFAVPAEVFVEIGLELKRRYPTSFVIGLANGYHGYLPTPEQHVLGGYETWRAVSACLEVDASTKIVAGLEELARQVD